MRLRSKLLIASVGVALVPLMVVSFISVWLARGSLREAVGAHVATIAMEKADAIALIITSRINEAQILANTAAVR